MSRYGRTRPISWTPFSEPEFLPLSPSTLGVSFEQTTHMSAAPVSSPFLHRLSPTSLESSPDPPSISQKSGHTEGAVGSIHSNVSVHGIRKRRLSQCISPAPSKRQRCPSITSGANPIPPVDGCRGGPTDPDEILQPTLQVPIDPDVPVNLGVFDWNSISGPFTGSASSLCM